MSEIEDVIRELKKSSGFNSYLIMNHDGIVIKHENMSLKTAVHFAYQMLGLTNKCASVVKGLLDSSDSELESIRLKTNDYEMIIAQHGNYTMIVTQIPNNQDVNNTELKKEEGEIKE